MKPDATTFTFIVLIAYLPSAPKAFMITLYVPGETEEATFIVAVALAVGITVEGLNDTVIPLGALCTLNVTCLL